MARDTSLEDGEDEKIDNHLLKFLVDKLRDFPTAEEIKRHWEHQEELYLQSREGRKLEEESRNLLRVNIQDMAGLRQMQATAISQTERLGAAQDRLADILENISDNLKNGFDLGSSVVKLFGKIVFVFLASLVILCLVIVWIAGLDLSYNEDGARIGRGQYQSQPQQKSDSSK